MKRLSDILISIIVLAIFLPFGILITLLIAVTTRGGVFYLQDRVGRYGKEFKLIKFRTMKTNADQEGKLTVGMRDSRITRIGYVLRRFKLDEFPQFINVLIGQMSIVGPRPEVKEYVELYTEEQRKVLSVRPGITDYASIAYFKENELLEQSDDPRKTYVEEIMPAKLALNMKYIEHPSFGQYIRIIWKTFLKIFS